MATLSWTNVFTKDLDALPEFYLDVFGFSEIPEMRNPVFRGIATGRSNIGFMAPEVYGILQLDDKAETSGAAFLLNIEVDSTDEVDRLTTVAIEHGATLRKAAATTSYGWYQAVLTDPEDNVVRINKVVTGPEF